MVQGGHVADATRIGYAVNMSECVQTPIRVGLLQKALLALAIVSAVLFVAAAGYLGYALIYSLSKGFEAAPAMTGFFAVSLPISLVISVAAASTICVQLRRRSRF